MVLWDWPPLRWSGNAVMPTTTITTISLDDESVAGEEDPGAALGFPEIVMPERDAPVSGSMAADAQPVDNMSDPGLKAAADYMKQHQLVLTTAESCTAGLMAAHLADLPGAGSLLEAAFVVYSPHAKMHCLGVNAQTIERCNLTSEEVAAEMARGALKASHDACLVIANTGVTDDTDPRIAAGTQCFAWLLAAHDGRAEKLVTETRCFKGDRNTIRDSAAVYALSQIPAKHAEWLKQPAGTPSDSASGKGS